MLPDASVADRSTMLWMNTTVVRGRGEAVVVATGMATRIGQVARMLAETPERKTPLQRQIDQLGRRLALVAAAAVTAVFIVGLLRGDTLAAMALNAIATRQLETSCRPSRVWVGRFGPSCCATTPTCATDRWSAIRRRAPCWSWRVGPGST